MLNKKSGNWMSIDPSEAIEYNKKIIDQLREIWLEKEKEKSKLDSK